MSVGIEEIEATNHEVSVGDETTGEGNIGRTRALKCRLPDDATPEDLEPLAVEHDLDLVARRRPRERRLDPPDPQRLRPVSTGPPAAKQLEHEPVERVLEVLGNDARRARVVLRLVGVRRRLVPRRVLDDDVGLTERGAHLGVLALEALDAALRGVDDVAALHLVEDGVVRPVDLVAAVHVGRDEEAVLARREALDLVRRRVRAQHVPLVEVVRVGEGPSRVVRGEAKVVKVLLDRDDGRQRVEVLKVVEVRLDQAAQDPDRVRGLEVQSSWELVEDGRRRVGEVVPRVRLAVDDEGFRRVRSHGIVSPRLPLLLGYLRMSESRWGRRQGARGKGASCELASSSQTSARRQPPQCRHARDFGREHVGGQGKTEEIPAGAGLGSTTRS